MHSMDNVGSTPAFLMKLWKLVNDPDCDDLICWSQLGKSFIIRDQVKFSQKLLPLYFKHKNLASFIRQLNMYGFHKVLSLDSGASLVEREEMEFAHRYFVRGNSNALENIKRKPAATSRSVNSNEANDKGVDKILSEVKDVKRGQDNIQSKLLNLKTENELLWREYATMRQQFSKQQKIIQKLVQFLVAMTKIPGKPIVSKRKYPHLALEGSDMSIPSTSKCYDHLPFEDLSSDTGSPSGPMIQEITGAEDLAAPRNIMLRTRVQESSGAQTLPLRSPAKKRTSSGNDTKGYEPSMNLVGQDPEHSIELWTDDANIVPYRLTEPVPMKDDFNVSPRIQSPNGPFLEVVDAMTPVNPAEIMPAIVTREMILNRAKNTPQTAGAGAAYVNESKLKSKSSLVPYSMKTLPQSGAAPSELRNPGIATSDKTPRSVIVSMPGGKKMNVKLAATSGAPRPSTVVRGGERTLQEHLTPGRDESQSNVLEPSDHKAPSLVRTCSGEELQHHVEDVQSSIDSLQELFSGNFNVDPSTFLSLFDSENVYDNDISRLFANGGITGNEVSIYNNLPQDTGSGDALQEFLNSVTLDTKGSSSPPSSSSVEESSVERKGKRISMFNPPKTLMAALSEDSDEGDEAPEATEDDVQMQDEGLQTPQISRPVPHYSAFDFS